MRTGNSPGTKSAAIVFKRKTTFRYHANVCAKIEIAWGKKTLWIMSKCRKLVRWIGMTSAQIATLSFVI